MILTSRDYPTGFDDGADCVVVGSGAGGAVVACGLAQAGRSVVVLEEGGHHPSGAFDGRPASAFAGMYRDGGMTMALGRPGVLVPMGRCVGGTTLINSGTCLRVPGPVWDGWRRHGLGHLTADSMAPYYDRVERAIGVQTPPREAFSGNAAVVARGAETLGWAHGPLPRNARECRGSGVCVFGCPRDAKQSMPVSYLAAAVRAGAVVRADSRVERVLVRGGRARGVVGHVLHPETGRPMARFRVRARAVILAAGALYTPWLLLVSRLANSSGQVGRNLHLHPATKASAVMPERVQAWAGVPQGWSVTEFHDEGILMEEASTPPGITAIGLPFFGPRNRAIMEGVDRLATFGALVADTTRGRVWRGPFGRPVMTYLLNRGDARRLGRAGLLLGRLLFAAGAERVFLQVRGFEEVTSREALERLDPEAVRPPDLDLSAFHPMGTCRMGSNPSSAVVRPDFRTHDHAGLYCVDASVFPESPHVNPQVTIMALALRAAEDIDRHLSVVIGSSRPAEKDSPVGGTPAC